MLSVERRVLTCSTRLLNSDTTLTESVVEGAAVDSTGAGAATATGAATGAGAATTGAGAAAAVVVEAALRPFLEAAGAVEAEAEVDILISVAEELFQRNKRGYAYQTTGNSTCHFFTPGARKSGVFWCV